MLRKKAFTLIELLVVISIIALLMAILMPTLKKVKQQAKAVLCQSNLKQWGLFHQMYFDDNNNQFFTGSRNASQCTKKSWEYAYWANLLRPYYSDNKDICLCPSATKSYQDGGQVPFGAWSFPTENNTRIAGEYGSYASNEHCTTSPWSPNSRETWKNINAVSSSLMSNIPMLGDSRHIIAKPRFGNLPGPLEDSAINTREYEISRFAINRHDGAINMLFMDNSVRRIRIKNLWDLKWHRTYTIGWYPDFEECAPWILQ